MKFLRVFSWIINTTPVLWAWFRETEISAKYRSIK
jgi:hypothetical protein